MSKYITVHRVAAELVLDGAAVAVHRPACRIFGKRGAIFRVPPRASVPWWVKNGTVALRPRRFQLLRRFFACSGVRTRPDGSSKAACPTTPAAFRASYCATSASLSSTVRLELIANPGACRASSCTVYASLLGRRARFDTQGGCRIPKRPSGLCFRVSNPLRMRFWNLIFFYKGRRSFLKTNALNHVLLGV